MLKMLKHIKKYTWALVLIVLLLAAQAVCDLWLPSYTAAIVDVGIQQQGIERSTPTIVRKSVLDALRLWMPKDEEQKYIEPNYHEATAKEAEALGANADETLLALGSVDAETLDAMDELFNRAFMLNGIIDGGGEFDITALLSSVSPNGDEVLDGDQAAYPQTPDAVVAVVGLMSDEERADMLRQIDEKLFTILPSGTLKQAAINAVKEEYAALHIDVSSMQSRAIWHNGLMMLLVTLIGSGAAVTVGYFGSVTAAGLGRDLREKVFDKVMNFGQREMDQFSTASLITRSTNDVQQVQGVMVMLLRVVIYAPIIGVGGVLRALQTNASMGWVILLGVALVVAVVLTLFYFAMPRFKRMQTQVDDVNRVMRETLTGLPVIRAFCTQKREEQRFDVASRALTKTHLFVGRLMSGMFPMMMLIMNGIAILIMWIGASGVNTGAMQVGDMMAYISYTMQIIMAFLMISLTSVMLPRASVSANRIQEVLDTPLSVADPETPVPLDKAMRGVVEFRDASFRYPGADEDTLRHISFTALPGQTTAILGGTGSGKSTLLNLIPRFYDVSDGAVLVDGVDVRNASMEALRDAIGYVPQKSVLFTGTIAENLSFGSEGMPEERLHKAAAVAQAEAFIMNREDAYQSEISQGGANVSGGQKQRLSIARAVAKEPEIYLFDDSFSALDFKTDAAVRRALNKEAHNATVIVVAQRISTVMHAECIVVLDDGAVAGIGTHAELMETCEAYRQIATSQLSKEELGNGQEA